MKKKELEVPKDDNFSVDVGDNRFSAVFNHPEFNIDPTNPNFKKTKNMEKILGEKQKRITSDLPHAEKDLVTKSSKRVIMGHLRLTIGHFRVTISHHRITIGHYFFFYKQT